MENTALAGNTDRPSARNCICACACDMHTKSSKPHPSIASEVYTGKILYNYTSLAIEVCGLRDWNLSTQWRKRMSSRTGLYVGREGYFRSSTQRRVYEGYFLLSLVQVAQTRAHASGATSS